MLNIAEWYNNHQAPAVLMIDDLSDAYIQRFPDSYANDWGYLCDQEGSAYQYLQHNLLSRFPSIKITFFSPYLRHAIINEHCGYPIRKYQVGERTEYSEFLEKLVSYGHEIAHHGSDHGRYLDNFKCTTGTNWVHEWHLFETVDEGTARTMQGKNIFLEMTGFVLSGGKYCGYAARENSREIIDRCNFLYWCEKVNYADGDHTTSYFGDNQILSFPTNFSGNSFVRFTYHTGDRRRDAAKRFLRFVQPVYTIISYYKLYQLYKNRRIISIQEHISPSTTWETIQSSNIVSDMKSLQKIFTFLKPLNIWYASCHEIARYQYCKDHLECQTDHNELILYFDNQKNLSDSMITIVSELPFSLIQNDIVYTGEINNKMHFVNIPIVNGENRFKIIQEGVG